MLKPAHKRSVADAVFDQLRDAILVGALAPGDALPSERALCVQLKVGRSAVREALVRLEQVGLVSTRHGDTTRVQDYRAHAGLELLPSLIVHASGRANPGVVRACLEMRAALVPDVCRLCAQRSPHVGAEAMAVVDAMEKETGLQALRALNVRFWVLVVAGSQNVAYQLAYNSLRHMFDLFERALSSALANELTHVDGYRAIARAISAKEDNAAARAGRDQVQRSLSLALQAISGLIAAEPAPPAT